MNKSPPKFEIMSCATFENRNGVAMVKRNAWIYDSDYHNYTLKDFKNVTVMLSKLTQKLMDGFRWNFTQ